MSTYQFGNKTLRKARRFTTKGVGVLCKIILCLIFAFPFYWMIVTAFKTNAEAIRMPPTLWPQNWNFSGFKTIFAEDLTGYLKNSLIVLFWVTLLQMIIMIPAAYAFARHKFFGKNLFFSWIMVGFMVPGQITFVAVYRMFVDAGLIDSYLPQIIPLMCNGFGIFLLRQTFMQVPEELVESAKLDEASEFQIIMKIMMPMAKSTIVTIMLLSVMGTWNSYFWPMVVARTNEFWPIPVYIEQLKNLEGGMKWPVIMAGNVVLILPVLIAFLVASKKIIASMAYRGVK